MSPRHGALVGAILLVTRDRPTLTVLARPVGDRRLGARLR
jgi:hypothetical protein